MMSHLHKLNRSVSFWSWSAVFVVGLSQFLANRFAINPDGISYLDLADGHGSWLNPYWSPLYPLLIRTTFWLWRPPVSHELVLIHLVNFLAYLGCFAALNFLVREIHERLARKGDYSEVCALSESELQIIAALLFLLMTQHYIRISDVSPDMLVATCCFAASALILRLQRFGITVLRLAGLGLVLGVGYLSKAVMFPMAFVFLTTALIETGNLRRLVLNSMVALLAFFAVAGPNIYALSKLEHRMTFGDSGKLNYMFLVDGVSFVHTNSPGPAGGELLHAPRRIFSQPDAYEFLAPVGGSYPPWNDPVYWHEGLTPRVNWRGMIARIRIDAGFLADLFFHESGVFFVWLLLVIVQYRAGLFSWGGLFTFWRILVPALILIAIYLPIRISGRYIGSAVVLIGLALYSSISVGPDLTSRKLISTSLAVLAVAVGLVVVPHFLTDLWTGLRLERNLQSELAEHLLNDFGLRAGDTVGCIDCLDVGGANVGPYWARIAKVRVVTEIPAGEKEVFLKSPAALQTDALQAMLHTGARVIVAHGNMGAGWRQIGVTGFFAYCSDKSSQ